VRIRTDASGVIVGKGEMGQMGDRYRALEAPERCARVLVDCKQGALEVVLVSDLMSGLSDRLDDRLGDRLFDRLSDGLGDGLRVPRCSSSAD
jgi:hypothetical protein